MWLNRETSPRNADTYIGLKSGKKPFFISFAVQGGDLVQRYILGQRESFDLE